MQSLLCYTIWYTSDLIALVGAHVCCPPVLHGITTPPPPCVAWHHYLHNVWHGITTSRVLHGIAEWLPNQMLHTGRPTGTPAGVRQVPAGHHGAAGVLSRHHGMSPHLCWITRV